MKTMLLLSMENEYRINAKLENDKLLTSPMTMTCMRLLQHCGFQALVARSNMWLQRM